MKNVDLIDIYLKLFEDVCCRFMTDLQRFKLFLLTAISRFKIKQNSKEL